MKKRLNFTFFDRPIQNKFKNLRLILLIAPSKKYMPKIRTSGMRLQEKAQPRRTFSLLNRHSLTQN